MTKKRRGNTVNPADYTKWAAADDAAVARLCEIAGKLGVPIITPRRCPDSGERSWKNIAGMYVPDGLRVEKDLARTLKLLNVKPPCIILRYQTAAVLSHEIGHHVSMFDTMIDEKMGRRVSPLLARLCERHKIVYYGDDEITQLAEMRARCLERRLLGENLPPTLRRFSERAWQDLQEKTNPTRRDPGRKK
jgi:hypothetical protein